MPDTPVPTPPAATDAPVVPTPPAATDAPVVPTPPAATDEPAASPTSLVGQVADLETRVAALEAKMAGVVDHPSAAPDPTLSGQVKMLLNKIFGESD